VYSRTNEAAGCSDEPGLRQSVARRLGYDPFVAASVNTVVAELRGGDSGGLKARVYVVRDGNMAGGARELSAPSRDCTELMAAVALALSIAIDPDALDRIERPSLPAGNVENSEERPKSDVDEKPAEPEAKRRSEPREGPRAAVTKKDVKLEASTTPPKASSSLDVTLGPLAYMGTGPAPAPSFGFGFTLGVVLDQRWVAAVEPVIASKSSASVSGNSAAGVRVSSWGSVFYVGYESKGMYGGALVEAERLTSEGYGVTNSITNRSWWAGAGLRIGYEVLLTRYLSMVPHVDGIAEFRKLRLRVAGEEAHATPALLGRFGLTLLARF
jgi:hypothetical protein